MKPIGLLYVHKSPPLLPILRQMNPIHINQFFSHMSLGLPSGLFPSFFPTETEYHSSFISCVLHAQPVSHSHK
jgi:hypothetical protein